jgi:tetratricopeptide (TPR) repeat protein
MMLAPLLLCAVELALRIAGYGCPTSYFLPAKLHRRDFFLTNEKFGLRFFPPALLRTPAAVRLDANKPANSCRIFLFGESAALGDPEPSMGMGRQLEVLLRERFPDVRAEVIPAAMTAINSHVLLPIARECARHQGDIWIIYMGNNEIVGPFGTGTVFGPQAPRLAFVRASLALKTTRLGQLFDTGIQKLWHEPASPKSWDSLNMFKEQQVRPDAPGRLRTYANFSRNLEDILQAGRRAGVPIVLCTVGVNLKDCAPFGSLHASNLDAAKTAAWDELYKAGVELQTSGLCQEALDKFSKAADLDAQFADLQFRLGQCHLALGKPDLASRDFERARDDDTLAFRADTRINKTIKDAALRHAAHGVYLVDAAESLRNASTDGITGHEFFYEHVHLNFEGNYLVARQLASQIEKILPPSVTTAARPEWASLALCARRLAVTEWDQARVWQAIRYRLSEPPYTGQLTQPSAVKLCETKLSDLSSHLTPDSIITARKTYEQALALRPDDPCLHQNFASFLEATGNDAQATSEARQVEDLLPQVPVTPYFIGLMLVRQGKTSEAAESFNHALELDHHYVPALNALGEVFANQQKTAAAENCFNRSLKLNPNSAETYLDLGFMEQSIGKASNALAHYHNAAGLSPDGAPAHFYAACALAAEHRSDESIEQFRVALQLNPRLWQACYLLGVELAAKGEIEQARLQFTEAISQRPDYARAHSNLGVAFAKEGNLQLALAEFKSALQINPADEAAEQNLKNLQAAQSHAP